MALSLTVKQGEALHIGKGIRVTVVGHKGNRYTVAIDAPGGVKILRSVHMENLDRGIQKMADQKWEEVVKRSTTAVALPSAGGQKLEMGTPFEPSADGKATAAGEPQTGNG